MPRTGKDILRIASVRSLPGHRRLLDFVVAVRDGEIPQTDLTRDLAARFEQILDGADPLTTLELRKRGRRRDSIGDIERRYSRIWNYIAQCIEADPISRGARARALNAAAKKFHLSRRQIEKIWARIAPTYHGLQELARQQRVIEAYITPAECEGWKDRDGYSLYRLARKRRQINRANSSPL
jgi:hypothetical protein